MKSDGSPARDQREVALEPLTLAEGRELALRLIGQDDPAAVALAETIVRESGGSPYFVYELVEYLKEGGELGEGGTLSTQFSLDSVLGRRIDRLPAEAESLLEVLAVAGQPLRQAIACKAADLGALGFSGLALVAGPASDPGYGSRIARRGGNLSRPDPGDGGQPSGRRAPA